MSAQLAANAIVLIHFAFILFVLFGAWLVPRWKWVAWLHVPAFAWGAAIEFFGAVCPLTPLEQRLREAAGEQWLRRRLRRPLHRAGDVSRGTHADGAAAGSACSWWR